MSSPAPASPAESRKSFMQKALDLIEKVGNKVPHPVVIFLILIGIVIVVAHLLYLLGASVSYEVIAPVKESVEFRQEGETEYYQTVKPEKYGIKTVTTAARSLLTADGIRFMYTSLIPSFMSFTALGLMIVAMVGAGVAEESGLVRALIHKLVAVSPKWALTYILSFVAILGSLAADAAYLVLIPLAGTAFLAVGRHPIAGIAMGFAAVAGAFTVNMLIKPLDAVLVEFTNDAIRMVDPSMTIGLASNVWFSIASVIFLTILVTLITERMIEPRLGKYQPNTDGGAAADEGGGQLTATESRGLRYALIALVAVLAVFGLLTIPAEAPLRAPETGELIGNSPFMGGLIGAITAVFLATGAAYGYGAGTMKSITDVIKAIEKAVTGLGGTIFLFLVISQFVSYFTYTNIGTILAINLADVLKNANIGPLPLLLGFIVVVAIIDLLITGAIAKWAIFAPVFVPLLLRLSVAPEAVLAAYRIGDSPMNAITPLNAYFALVVGFTQKYDKNAGVGTVVSLMLPYVVWMFVLWTLLFAAWFQLGLPWGV